MSGVGNNYNLSVMSTQQILTAKAGPTPGSSSSGQIADRALGKKVTVDGNFTKTEWTPTRPQPQVQPGVLDAVPTQPLEKEADVQYRLPTGAQFSAHVKGNWLAPASYQAGVGGKKANFDSAKMGEDGSVEVVKVGVQKAGDTPVAYQTLKSDGSTQMSINSRYESRMGGMVGGGMFGGGNQVLPGGEAHLYTISADKSGKVTAYGSDFKTQIPCEPNKDGTGVILHTGAADIGVGWLVDPKDLQGKK